MKKIKTLFFCVALVAMFDGYSQAVCGKVIYKIQLAENGVDIKNSPDRELIEATMEIANKQTATLKFNKVQSSFILDQYLIADAEDSGLRRWARSMAFVQTVSYDYFFDKTTNTAVQRKENGQLLEIENKKLEWEITVESKKIDNYLCYKAIYLNKFINRRGKSISVPITAWFAPSLPYSYGPKYFNGLPGLILELQDRETTFLASSISISNTEELKIEFPTGKTIPKEEYEKKMEAQMNR
jgi:GLPGLI family protein